MVEEKSNASQNGYAKPVSNGTANVYYSNGINNGFMSTKPVEGGTTEESSTSAGVETRKTK